MKTLFILISLIVIMYGCRKNPCFYNNCDPVSVSDCYISKKLVRQDTVKINGKALTRFDVDTSYYIDADCKIIGADSLIDYAGVVNINPHEYCDIRYNYSTVYVYDRMVMYLKGDSVYLWKILSTTGDTLLFQVNEKWYNYSNRHIENFMYN